MAHQLTSEGGNNLAPSAPFQLGAEGGANLSPAAHAGITAEGGTNLGPAAPAALVAEFSLPATAATGTVNVSLSLTSGQSITIGGIYSYTAIVPDNGAAARIYSDAASLAAVINGERVGVSADPNVSATVVGTLVTLTARTPGTAGNSIGLSKTGAAMTVSGATLSGGAGVAAPYQIKAEGGVNLAPSAPAQLTPEASY